MPQDSFEIRNFKSSKITSNKFAPTKLKNLHLKESLSILLAE
jgi:hypothetical protein